MPADRPKLEVGGGGPADRSIPVVTSHDTFELLNFATHSPEDKQRDRRSRSARLERTGLKQLFYYRSAGLCAPVTETDDRTWPW
jgi:hypothetical protein